MSLNYKDPESGVSEKARLEQVWTQTGIRPEKLEEGELPKDLEYLREIFWDIWNSEGFTWSEVYYYQDIMDVELSGYDLYILRSAFGACSDWLHKKNKPKKDHRKPPRKGTPARRR